MSDGEILRDSKGRVLPGRTLNPGGRPRQVRELVALARQSVPRALALAADYIENEQLDARVRLEAAKLVLSYGLGSPPKLEPNGEDDEVVALRAMSDEDLDRLVRQHLIAKSSASLPGGSDPEQPVEAVLLPTLQAAGACRLLSVPTDACAHEASRALGVRGAPKATQASGPALKTDRLEGQGEEQHQYPDQCPA